VDSVCHITPAPNAEAAITANSTIQEGFMVKTDYAG
jgi:hypothetical protein